MRPREAESGQSVSEVALLSPLFLLMTFAILQTCHLGIALALVNYGASSVARQSVQENIADVTSSGQKKFDDLMIAGLTRRSLTPHRDDNGDVVQNITITACADLPAYPFVGAFLANGKTLRPGGTNPCGVGGAKRFGPVAITTQAPYRFIIHGEATARMNYKP